MKKIIVDKQKFQKLLIKRYGEFIKDDERITLRLYTMLAIECDVDMRTIYNFTNSTFSTKLLKNIVNALNISNEDFKELIYFEEEK